MLQTLPSSVLKPQGPTEFLPMLCENLYRLTVHCRRDEGPWAILCCAVYFNWYFVASSSRATHSPIVRFGMRWPDRVLHREPRFIALCNHGDDAFKQLNVAQPDLLQTSSAASSLVPGYIPNLRFAFDRATGKIPTQIAPIVVVNQCSDLSSSTLCQAVKIA